MPWVLKERGGKFFNNVAGTKVWGDYLHATKFNTVDEAQDAFEWSLTVPEQQRVDVTFVNPEAQRKMSDAPNANNGPTGNINFDILIKLLGMTGSSNDNEALVAMRKANAQLEKIPTTWEALLRGRVTIVQDPFASMAPPPSTAKRAPPGAPTPPPPPPQARQSGPTVPPRSQQAKQTQYASAYGAGGGGSAGWTPPPPKKPSISPHFRTHSGAWAIYTDQSATYKAGLNLSVRRRDGSMVDVTLFSELKRDADGIYWTFHDNAPPPVDPNLSKWQNRQKARTKLDDIA